ncbi:hypothetical protein GUITHDRAFT_122483 [Guillardia theta CCMP2712]|uniref:Uncharacterized protein n=1 Tax=Guillardia theta (strain CCMP2712) TaxID=905079 RepID=L1I4Y2_GUITC|nr:hypothetical protein GUITHDRAFT_122483 [Guillardia theta CCMP2712]EKX31318.1 hypothetical protein GUITHDRAFT_122483 [Guillardia theta CCMP2712]|eukprot:XP_005818298.1 hypothetical protein GUITHDRAFT_122483 [Guillardia theta CCMP2712]
MLPRSDSNSSVQGQTQASSSSSKLFLLLLPILVMFSELYIPSQFSFGMQPAIASTSMELMAKQTFLGSNSGKAGAQQKAPPHALGAVKPARFQMLRASEAEEMTGRLLLAQKEAMNRKPW